MNKLDGFSLIEVLTSIFVLSLGVIGVAGMQLAALRTTQQSRFQSSALEFASEMAEKIRANTQTEMRHADNPYLAVDYRSADGEPAAPAKLCYGEDCDADEHARFEIYEWQRRIKAALPDGRARICHDANPWDSAANALTWECKTEADAGNIGSLVIKLGWNGKGQNPDGSAIEDARMPFLPSVAITVMPNAR